jgi:type II secretory pathway pseudopilin PulG
MNNRKNGLTLIEVMIIMVIAVSFFILGFVVLYSQIGKSRDAKRKDDLQRIRIAFEDYFNDNGCYPRSEVLEDCGGDTFKPYLEKIPCDPESKEPYLIYVQQTVCPSWYIVLTKMEYLDGLSNSCQSGCNFENEDNPYHYYIASGNVSPWEIDEFSGYGDTMEEECPVETLGCFEIDGEGKCNSSNDCTINEHCFSDENCTSACSIESCN